MFGGGADERDRKVRSTDGSSWLGSAPRSGICWRELAQGCAEVDAAADRLWEPMLPQLGRRGLGRLDERRSASVNARCWVLASRARTPRSASRQSSILHVRRGRSSSVHDQAIGTPCEPRTWHPPCHVRTATVTPLFGTGSAPASTPKPGSLTVVTHPPWWWGVSPHPPTGEAQHLRESVSHQKRDCCRNTGQANKMCGPTTHTHARTEGTQGVRDCGHGTIGPAIPRTGGRLNPA